MKTQILFNGKNHTYTTGKKIQYSSVSTLIGKFKQPFDGEYWSKYKAYEKLLTTAKLRELRKEGRFELGDANLFPWLNNFVDPKEAAKEIKAVLKDWKNEKDKSIVKGNNYHDFKEKQSIEMGYVINPFTNVKFNTVESTIVEVKKGIEYRKPAFDSLKDLQDGYHPELILWNNKYKLAGQADRIFVETINGLKYVSVDDFKGFSLDTPIATIDGWKIMGDITVGDIIFDGNGNPTKVQHVSQVHYNPCYKITFDNNSTLICDHEHKWVINKFISSSKKEGSKRIDVEMLTTDIFEYYKNNTLKLAISINPIKIENDIELPIDPYILGTWLADGNRTCGTVTCLNDKVWDEIKKRDYTISENHSRNNDKAESRTIYNIHGKLKELKVLNNKHIPDIYLRASYKQRLDLLRGYMDGDGHLNICRKRCDMRTTSIKQAQDIQTLVHSLGYKCTIVPYKTKGFGKENIQAYALSFRMKESCFLSRNFNYSDIIEYTSKNNFNYIKSIEKIDTVPTKCLAVESEDHTYLAGKCLIKTHNTNKEIKTTNGYWQYDKETKKKYYKGNYMLEPLSHLEDCKLNHYKLQICTYAWMLEQEGYIVKDLAFTHLNEMYRFAYMKEEVEAMLGVAYEDKDYLNMI